MVLFFTRLCVKKIVKMKKLMWVFAQQSAPVASLFFMCICVVAQAVPDGLDRVTHSASL